MKFLKKVLSTLAFIIAIGAVLTNSANNSRLVTKYGSTPTGCKLGTLDQPVQQCGPTDQGLGLCTVSIAGQQYFAYNDASCIQLCYKQF